MKNLTGTPQAEMLLGAFFAAIGVPFLIYALNSPGISPRGFDTRILGALLIACSALLIGHGLYRRRKERR